MTDSTAVARRDIPDHIAARIEERKAINEVSRQIANLSWGKGLSAVALQSVAEYARRFNLDAASEIDILGGRIYRNANYFMRRGGELLRRGVVTDISVQHVNADARLDELAKRKVEGAQDEIDRRALARIRHNIPEGAKGAVVVRITTASGAVVEGANYAGVGKDPVGAENPGKTAESRAYRRAWRLLVDTIPELKAEEGEVSEAGTTVSAVVSEEREKDKALAASMPGQRQLTPGGYDGTDDDLASVRIAATEALDLDPITDDEAA